MRRAETRFLRSQRPSYGTARTVRFRMSNVIGGHKGTRYFQVPDSFVDSGDLRDLSGSAVKYYVFLCQQMNKTGQVELEYTNEQISTYTAIKDHNTARKAREELREHGRIRLRKGPSGGFIHVMLSDSDEVFPPAAGRKPVRYHVKRERPSSDTAQAAKPQPPRETPISLRPHAPPQAPIITFCRVHRRETEHWERDGQLNCRKCHPDPRAQKTAQPAPQLTARDVGFT